MAERMPAPTTEGTGIYLPGNAVRALSGLGLGAQVEQHAVRIERQRIADHRGRVLMDMDVAELWNGVGACLALPRATLHRVLLDGAGEVPIRWEQVPRAITADDGSVTVELSDGTAGRYDLVLGADGVRSAVRRLVFDAPEPQPVGQYARRFVVRRPESEPVWSALLGSGSSVLTIPIGDGHVYCYCDGPIGNPAPLRQLLSAYAPPVPELLEALDQDGGPAVHEGPIEEVVLDRWSSGNVLLVGDAAHATSPNMAQGAAMALEDALVLADSLATADGITAALARFERRRRPRTDWVLRQTHRRDRTRNFPPAVRNTVLTRFGRRIFHANYRPLREPA
jgi:2-polyprenyl-6-methoxyphenol hydroxylase-like FAD-dependent oxidoreductase